LPKNESNTIRVFITVSSITRSTLMIAPGRRERKRNPQEQTRR
jgi:hypothetical protein